MTLVRSFDIQLGGGKGMMVEPYLSGRCLANHLIADDFLLSRSSFNIDLISDQSFSTSTCTARLLPFILI